MLLKTIAGLLFFGYANAAIVISLVSTSGVNIPYKVEPDGSCFSLNGGTLAQFNDHLQQMKIPSGYECTIWEYVYSYPPASQCINPHEG
ncbi:uncharacterized protein N7484_004997 [Penicillium longicatenatum]|uniref:uncharacterized protein n=1 Tax=Penicillium longicatenatum TaxID=1561947 RepID=UPI0025491933|nr:uncharacterized protein N7484_004997 [Penicillium longicatenatum]KAJ5651274.1 hypothetical protein N7484_004997 [Penicillium longicatenatum]